MEAPGEGGTCGLNEAAGRGGSCGCVHGLMSSYVCPTPHEALRYQLVRWSLLHGANNHGEGGWDSQVNSGVVRALICGQGKHCVSSKLGGLPLGLPLLEVP